MDTGDGVMDPSKFSARILDCDPLDLIEVLDSKDGVVDFDEAVDLSDPDFLFWCLVDALFFPFIG